MATYWKSSLTSLLACASLSPLAAQDLGPDDPFFELINPAKTPTTGTVPKSKTTLPVPPTEVAAMMQKWGAYEEGLTAKFKENIIGGRKVAKELLINKALTADPTTRDRFVAEAKRLEKLSVDLPLGVGLATPKDARDGSVAGRWDTKWWHYDFTAGGLAINTGDMSVRPWRWIDRRANVIVLGGTKLADAMWLAGPDKMLVMNTNFERYEVKKYSNKVTTILQDEILAKLQVSEEFQRTTLATDLESKRCNLVAWLLSKAKELPAEDALTLLPKITDLETQTRNGASRLAGLWSWEKQAQLRFQGNGVVSSRIGSTIGSWSWIGIDQAHFTVVLNNGQTPNDVYMASAPKNSADLLTTVHRLGEGKFTATRTLP